MRRAAGVQILRVMSRFTFPKFLVVGAIGTVTNLAVFFVVVDLARWNPSAGAILAFIIAVGQNYVLNHTWTFAARVGGASPSLRGYQRYLLVNSVGLAVNLVVLWLVLRAFDPQWKVLAQASGILAGTAVNYLGSTLWVFLRHE